MCEFKIIKQNDGSQILEDIVVLSYTENNELLFKDILGGGGMSDSALILDVNTMNQTTIILEHPLIKDFIGLMRDLNKNKGTLLQIESLQNKLEELKSSI